MQKKSEREGIYLGSAFFATVLFLRVKICWTLIAWTWTNIRKNSYFLGPNNRRVLNKERKGGWKIQENEMVVRG